MKGEGTIPIEEIKERCAAAGLRQADVAQICGVGQATVSNWWSHKHQMPLDKALLLRDALNMTLDEICGEKYADKRLQAIADIFALLDVAYINNNLIAGQGWFVLTMPLSYA